MANLFNFSYWKILYSFDIVDPQIIPPNVLNLGDFEITIDEDVQQSEPAEHQWLHWHEEFGKLSVFVKDEY